MSELPARHLWIVRHGETEWSRDGRHTGRTDVALTENGRRDAAAIGALLGAVDFSLVLSSPLQRALDTAHLAGFADPDLTDDLVEWDYGSYEGRRTAEIREQVPGWSIWSHGCDGESAQDVAIRVDRVVSRARLATDPVLVFGHGHSLRVLTARWLGLDARDGRLFALDTGTLSVLGAEREWPAIRDWHVRP